MFIEDIIKVVAGHMMFGQPPIKFSSPFEEKFIDSLALQISNSNGLTVKQATLSVRILEKIEPQIIAIIGKKTWDFSNPQFAKPFRQLSIQRTITIKDKKIFVGFPYDEPVIQSIKEYKNTRPTGSTIEWDMEEKAWVFSLTEPNLGWIKNNLKEFQADDEFKSLVSDIEHIEENFEPYIPMLSLVDDRPKLINVHASVPELESEDWLAHCFHAKRYGVAVYSDRIQDFIDSAGPVTKAVLNPDMEDTEIWIDSRVHGVDAFKDVIDHGAPILFVLPGGSEYQHLKNWHEFMLSRGIKTEEMSVMFRLPNEGKGDFNIYVKEHNLNNAVTENTKAVFVSIKIPKPLVKTDIKFDVIINLGYYSNTHFSMETVLMNAPTLIYYTDSQPKTNYKRWLLQR